MSCLFYILLYIGYSIHLFQYAVFKVRIGTSLLQLIPNGDGEIRTLDPLLARQVLSQLSYTPIMDAGLPSCEAIPIFLVVILLYLKTSEPVG